MKRLIKKSETLKELFNIDNLDYDTREAPFIYLDGKILIGSDGDCHHELIDELFSQEPFSKMSDKERDNLPTAAGHIAISKDGIKCAIMESDLAWGVSLEEVFNALKKHDPSIKEYYYSGMGELCQVPDVELTKASSLIINDKYCMKRLIRKSMMDLDMFKSTIDQLGDEGRTVLKTLEEYKFKLEQAGRILQNDPELSQKLVQKRKTLDAAAGQIYSVVFDIENIDITQMYENQQFLINNPGMGGGAPTDGQAPPMGGQPTPPPPNGAPNPNGEEDNDSAPIGGGGGDAGSAEPAGDEEETDEDTDNEEGGEDNTEEDTEEPTDNSSEEEPTK
jgi:hypothetical protein